jgi:hypothetical protein
MSTLNKKLTSFFKNGHWGIVNAEGRIIIPACYDAILGFDYNESAHLFLFSVKKGKLWGVIDQNSAVIIPFSYQKIGVFSKNMCSVCRDKKWNIINKKGELLLERWYKEIIRLNHNCYVLYNGTQYRLFNISNRKNKKICYDENGIYSYDGKTLLFPFVKSGVVFVKGGVQNLSYSLTNDPDYKLKPQISNIKRIVFAEGVIKINAGWAGLLLEESEHNKKIAISLPSTVSIINNEEFEKMDSSISYIYIPRRKAHTLKSILSHQLLKHVRINRIFCNSCIDFLHYPSETFFTFWLPSSRGFKSYFCLIIYLIGIVFFLIHGYHAYYNTFLLNHLNLLVIFLVVGFSWLVGVKIMKRKGYRKVSTKANFPFCNIIINWYIFLSIILIILFNSIFIINKYCCKQYELAVGNIMSLSITSRNARIMHLKIGPSEGSAIYYYVGDDSFDGINTCKVYYSKGLFGWLVVDRITH